MFESHIVTFVFSVMMVSLSRICIDIEEDELDDIMQIVADNYHGDAAKKEIKS